MLADLGLGWRAEHLIDYRFTPQRGMFGRLGEHQPVYLWESEEHRRVDGFPLAAGTSIGVALSFDRSAATVGPGAPADTATGEEIYELAAFTSRCLPRLRGDFVRAGTWTHATTPDRRPLLGRHPSHEQVTVAAGFDRHGFAVSPVVGEVLAELSAGGRSPRPAEAFAPARFATSPAAAA